MNYSIKPVGDSAIKVHFNEPVSSELNGKISAFCRKIEQLSVAGVIELVPAFDSVTIYYQSYRISFEKICRKLNGVDFDMDGHAVAYSRLIHVPVLYGGEHGPDLARVAECNRLSVDEVVTIHQKPVYLVYMLGFLPGFPYLGGMDQRIATPRLADPRKAISAGSVGIAHEQTGIYPTTSPGGWNIIGKTPLRLFDIHREKDAFLLRAGDYVQFYNVTMDEFLAIEQQVDAGTFDVKVSYR